MATYKVGADGKAQSGLSAGDSVVTKGGTYKITGVNSDGSYKSEKVSNTTTSTYTGSYANGSASSGGSSSSPSNRGSSGSSGSSGASYSGNTVQADSSGNAPSGTKIGDYVTTKGGTYQVVAEGTPGASYNPVNGLYSIKVDNNKTYPTTSGSYGSNYTPTGSYLDQGLTPDEKVKVDALSDQWYAAMAQGNKELADKLHAQAEYIRAQHGYSGGTDGSEYHGLEAEEGQLFLPTLPTYTPQIDATNTLYDSALAKSKAALEAAYNSSKLALEQAKAKIPATYQAQANTTAANAEKEKQAFNEQAAYSGLNTGTGSQVQLAMANQAMADQASIRAAEANALQDAENQLSALYVEYQGNIAQAIANNEYDRAAALLAEYKQAAQSVVDVASDQAYLNLSYTQNNTSVSNTNQDRLVAMAEALADVGDYSGYLALGWTSDMVKNAEATWKAANPDIMARKGYYS